MLQPPELHPDMAAGLIARFLKARGVDRVFALCVGHQLNAMSRRAFSSAVMLRVKAGLRKMRRP